MLRVNSCAGFKGVARSKFIDRAKNHLQETSLLSGRQPTVSDIRESSYKLPKSNGKQRQGHSLEKKKPINLNSTLPSPHAQPVVNVQRPVTDRRGIDRKAAGSIKEGGKTNVMQELLGMISGHQWQPEKSVSEDEMSLQQEEHLLGLLAQMWGSVSQMKEEGYFVEETQQIERVLNGIVVKLIKNKVKAEVSASPGEIPSLTITPVVKQAQLIREETQQPSVAGFHQPSNYPTQRQEDEPQGCIQLKKIMYILEQRQHCHTSRPFQPLSPSPVCSANNRPNPPLSHDKGSASSFNASLSQEPTLLTICQYDKENKHHNSWSERVYLRSIVKKRKKGAESPMQSQGSSEQHCQSCQEKAYSPSKMLHQISGSSYSSQPIQQVEESSMVSEQEQRPLPAESDSLSIIEEANEEILIKEAIGEGSEGSEPSSKRALLNNIITMLNQKYHKNIPMARQ